jgi:hypothetical protein
MVYTQNLGRKFWLAFDNHFKFESEKNGLAKKYDELGDYSRPSRVWRESRRAGNPQIFATYVVEKKAPIEFLAKEQKAYFERFFGLEMEDVVAAFQDFAFGIFASPNAPHREDEPVHTMNGAGDYLSWHGFNEAAILSGVDANFWTHLRWINGMAWELQVKAGPAEIFPNQNQPLPTRVTQAIRKKWQHRTAEEIAQKFDHFHTRPADWLIGEGVA